MTYNYFKKVTQDIKGLKILLKVNPDVKSKLTEQDRTKVKKELLDSSYLQQIVTTAKDAGLSDYDVIAIANVIEPTVKEVEELTAMLADSDKLNEELKVEIAALKTKTKAKSKKSK